MDPTILVSSQQLPSWSSSLVDDTSTTNCVIIDDSRNSDYGCNNGDTNDNTNTNDNANTATDTNTATGRIRQRPQRRESARSARVHELQRRIGMRQHNNNNNNNNKNSKNRHDNNKPYNKHKHNHNHNTHQRTSRVDLPRMVHRNLPFHQSRNSVRMKNSDHKLLWKLMFIDWFHALLRLPAYFSIPFLLLLWISFITLFGYIYWFLDHIQYGNKGCGLRTTADTKLALMGAIAFSLETCTTVGYSLPGTSDALFEAGCELLQVTIFTEMVWSMMFNAFLFSFFFSLLSKSENRATQIIFTNKLLINVDENNQAYARLQCYDIDSSHPLVEAHARMYVLDHKLKMHTLRLADPNDDLGGVLYPSVPADIVHVIDHHSVLSPQKFPFIESSNGLTLRSLDSATGNRDEVICPVCGEAYGTFIRLKKHIEFNAMIEAADGNSSSFPKGKSHVGFQLPDIQRFSLEEVRKHIEHTLSEIVVVVEAIDPQLSGTFQSLQSYKYCDLVFGAEFASCLSNEKGTFQVDMKRFHKTKTTMGCCKSSGHPAKMTTPPMSSRKQSIFVDTRDVRKKIPRSRVSVALKSPVLIPSRNTTTEQGVDDSWNRHTILLPQITEEVELVVESIADSERGDNHIVNTTTTTTTNTNNIDEDNDSDDDNDDDDIDDDDNSDNDTDIENNSTNGNYFRRSYNTFDTSNSELFSSFTNDNHNDDDTDDDDDEDDDDDDIENTNNIYYRRSYRVSDASKREL